MIEPFSNVEPLGLPIPAPWLLGLKLFGFFLHVVFMNLWLAGMPTALLLLRSKARVADRLFKGMPFFMAFGINAGIVPLLFIQTLYPQFYYPATILQAWFWFLVIPLLMVAYYSVYLAAFERYRAVSATLAALLLVWIGLTFSAAMSFTASPDAWSAVFSATADAGAVDGWFINIGYESLLRFLLMVGIALGTLAAFLGVDSEYLAADSDYQAEARALVAPLYFLGLCIFGGAGIGYGFSIRDELPGWLWMSAGGAMPAGFILAILYWRRPSKEGAASLAVVQTAVIFFNALARQQVQTRALEDVAKLEKVPVRGDWDSFFLFVVAFIVVLVALGWLARLAFLVARPDATPGKS